MIVRKLCILISLLLAAPVFADTIAVIGTGNVGGALGPEFAAQGHTIVYGSRNPDGLKAQDLVKKSGENASARSQSEAVVGADIVVLAVPGSVVMEVVKGLGDLSGKIIIDATNPLAMTRPMHFEFAVETSLGEMVQAAVPEAKVVKAFNTVNWQMMISPEDSNGPITVPLVGNDQAAKEKVALLVEGMGLEPIDLGPIENAHWTEYGVVVMLNNRFSERPSYEMHLRQPD